MEQYTKGEWEYFEDNYPEVTNWQDDRMVVIATVNEDLFESEANAHLISASPDLYEALKQIYEDYGFAFLKDILAKAEGKS